MEQKEACRLINEVGLHYRPTYSFRASPGYNPYANFPEDSRLSAPFFTPAPEPVYIIVRASADIPNSDVQYAPDYASVMHDIDVSFNVRVDDLSTEQDFWERMMISLMEHEIHEAREFFKVGRSFDAPFHPHTESGRENFSRLTKR